MMKKILVLLLSVVVLFLYFPIFCFVKEITVEGNAIVSVDEIKKTSELSGKLLAFHNKESSRDRILNIKLINKVSFKQLSLTEVKIIVEEKRILMFANVGNISGYVDEDSNLIRNIGEYLTISYPILSVKSETNIKEGVSLFKLLIEDQILRPDDISEILLDEIIGATVFMSDGTEIYLGKGKIRKKISNLTLILEDGKRKEMKESYIDISNIKKGVVNYNL
ncbi:cell division protein FtsQ [bacterium]|jgi:cell division septal protein FtsQ|nr:cell division protein FtsQ [bacterium]MBT3795064.1 cell division protein FtsQ [bacterium]MBT4634440.1 cell division protein FtsQ [bacterium]